MTSEMKMIQVTKESMPVSCPPKATDAWDLHPRVYLKMNEQNESKCPYCGQEYQLIG